MIQLLFNWKEAAKRPWATAVAVSISGLLVGGLVGYFRFGHSLGYGAALGLGVALVLGAVAWRNVREPTLGTRPIRIGATTFRLALPFLALAVAVAVGAALSSFTVFLITLAVGLAVGLVLRRIVPR